MLSSPWRKAGARPHGCGQLLPAGTARHTAAPCRMSPVPHPRAPQLRPGSSAQGRALPRHERPTAFLLHPQPPPDQWAALTAPRLPSVPQSCQEALTTAPAGHVYLHEKNHRHGARRRLPAGTASAGTGRCPLHAAGPGHAGCCARPPPSHLPRTGRGQSHFADAVFSEVGVSDVPLAARTVQGEVRGSAGSIVPWRPPKAGACASRRGTVQASVHPALSRSRSPFYCISS